MGKSVTLVRCKVLKMVSYIVFQLFMILKTFTSLCMQNVLRVWFGEGIQVFFPNDQLS